MPHHSETVSGATRSKNHDGNLESRTAGRESDLLVPLLDEVDGKLIYDPSILRWALIGATVGALVLGSLAASLAYGNLSLVGLGPFSASGEGVAVSTGGGIGLAVGGLIGALAAVFRIPSRTH